jgi:hypothetical protein
MTNSKYNQEDLNLRLLSAALRERNQQPEPIVMKEDLERRLRKVKSRKMTKRTRFIRYHADRAFELRNAGKSYREIAEMLRLAVTGKYVRQLMKSISEKRNSSEQTEPGPEKV